VRQHSPQDVLVLVLERALSLLRCAHREQPVGRFVQIGLQPNRHPLDQSIDQRTVVARFAPRRDGHRAASTNAVNVSR
jgi:hypothetical protein